jgi:hypothetical protein
MPKIGAAASLTIGVLIGIAALLGAVFSSGCGQNSRISQLKKEAEINNVSAVKAGRAPQNRWPYAELPSNSKSVPAHLRYRAISNLGEHQELGLRFNRARYVSTSVGGGIWVVGGRHLTCIFQAVKAAASCVPDAVLVKRGVQLVVGSEPVSSASTKPRYFIAYGIEPVGVREVILRPIEGPAKRVSVVNGAFSARASSPIEVEAAIR